MKNRLRMLLVATLIGLGSNGCSVYMAAKQPGRLDVSLFQQGTPRGLLLAEFGLPVVAEEKDGKRVEIFKFKQGYSGGAKTGRAIFHGAADVFTLGLWEVVGTPTEGAFDGTDMAYQVTYDSNDKVSEVVALKKR